MIARACREGLCSARGRRTCLDRPIGQTWAWDPPRLAPRNRVAARAPYERSLVNGYVELRSYVETRRLNKQIKERLLNQGIEKPLIEQQ